jgi:hypothetical protein
VTSYLGESDFLKIRVGEVHHEIVVVVNEGWRRTSIERRLAF